MYHTPPMERSPERGRSEEPEVGPTTNLVDMTDDANVPRATKQFSVHKLFLDFFLLCLLGIGIVIFKFVLKEAYIRGFYCDDETIRYPFIPSTVSTGLLMGLAVPLPIITILIFEANRLFRENKSRDPFLTIPGTFALNGKSVHRFLVRIYIFIGYFLAGACMSQMLTDIAKYSIGRLRPHFIAVCNPDFSKLNCSNSARFPLAAERYIVEPHCRGMKEFEDDPGEMAHLLREARVSFPSGHASFSFYCAIYTVLYLESRVVWPLYRPLLRPIIEFVFVALAFACSLSRISDYKHHWSDVLAGAVLGTSIALITGLQVAQLFARRETTYKIIGNNVVLIRAGSEVDGNRPLALQTSDNKGPKGQAPRVHMTDV